jgi:hypothetical protein
MLASHAFFSGMLLPSALLVSNPKMTAHPAQSRFFALLPVFFSDLVALFSIGDIEKYKVQR